MKHEHLLEIVLREYYCERCKITIEQVLDYESIRLVEGRYLGKYACPNCYHSSWKLIGLARDIMR